MDSLYVELKGNLAKVTRSRETIAIAARRVSASCRLRPKEGRGGMGMK